jgi:hypothetical protein
MRGASAKYVRVVYRIRHGSARDQHNYLRQRMGNPTHIPRIVDPQSARAGWFMRDLAKNSLADVIIVRLRLEDAKRINQLPIPHPRFVTY